MISGALMLVCIGLIYVQTCRDNEFVAVEQPVEAFTNILFSSGTTGIFRLKPKPFLICFIYQTKFFSSAYCILILQFMDYSSACRFI